MSEVLYTVEQAAEKLQMSPGTVRRMLRDRQLPGAKVGAKEWRIPADELREFFGRAVAERLGYSEATTAAAKQLAAEKPADTEAPRRKAGRKA
jgi:excisionase family DNA binding protein